MTDQTRWWLVGTGALMAIGSLLPWVQAGIFSMAGTDGDGVFVLIGGVIIAIIGLAKKATTGTGIGAIVIAGFGLITIGNIFANLSELVTDPDAILSVSPGSGLMVAGLASLFALIAGFKTFSEREHKALDKLMPTPNIKE